MSSELGESLIHLVLIYLIICMSMCGRTSST